MNKIGLGIPFYNEFENLRKIVDDIEKFQIDDIDFYLLNNGSTSREFLDYFDSISRDNIALLTLENNAGFGGGVKFLISNMPNEFVGWMPGNYKVKPKDLSIVTNSLNSSQSIQVSKAVRSDRKTSDRIKTGLLGVVTSIYYQKNMFDSGGTPTLVRREYISTLTLGPSDYSFEAFTLYLSRVLNLQMVRDEVPYGQRIHGKSHWQNGLKAELNLLFLILRQKKQWRRALSRHS